MNKLIKLLEEINRVSENSNPVIHDLSTEALARSKKIIKTVIPKGYEEYINNYCSCGNTGASPKYWGQSCSDNGSAQHNTDFLSQ